MAIFFKRITPGNTYPAANAPDVELPAQWQPKRIQIVNEDGTITNDAFISFDGVSDDGHVSGDPGLFAAEITYLNQAGVRKLWFKKGSGSAPVLRVLVEQ